MGGRRVDPRFGLPRWSFSLTATDANLHLYLANRGVLLTPFHNMALMSPATTAADVDRHSEVFAAAVAKLLA